MDRSLTPRRRSVAVALALALLVAGVAAAQVVDPLNTATEGYDPMRQISTQFLRPNVLLVFDVSGSMAWDEISQHDVGVDQLGTGLTVSWTAPAGSGSCSGTGANMKCTTWKSVLNVSQTHPSRMATVKNALGSTLTVTTPWTPPGTSCSDPSRAWPALSANWSTGVTGPTQTLNNTSQTAWKYTFTWTKTSGTAALSPGNPFPLTDLQTSPPTIGCGCEVIPPSDLVGKSATTVNWGLEIFSGVAADCDQGTLVVYPDSNDTGDVAAIEACLKANTTSTAVGGITYKGLFASGGTPTKGALVYAASVVSKVAGGGSVTNAAGSYTSTNFPTTFQSKRFSIPADPKLACGRVYAAILVTDGLSNTCNPNSGGNWAEPCLTCTSGSGGPGCPDGGYSGYTCPGPYPTIKTLVLAQQDKFIGEKTDALWQLVVGSRHMYTRTWVIGVSDQVGPCELNYAAYRGRTDANSPNGDSGFDTSSDQYLPEGTPGNYDSPTCPDHQPPHGSYAYFATTAKALTDAFTAIIAAVGTGDYTTSAPSVTSSPLSTTGMIGFLSSAAYPKWQGHLYAYDISADCSVTAKWDCTRPCGWVDQTNPAAVVKSNCLWDAGEVVSIGGLNPDGTSTTDGSRKSPNNGLTRKLYTWNPSSGNALVPIDSTSGTVTTLNALCGACGITAQVADFMLGNNGSGASRTWKLGAIVNSTQAVVGPPTMWKQNNLQSHTSFEDTYQNRHPVVWAGSDDGFIHGFDAIDGAELVALVPPEQLAKQVTYYNTYISKPAEFVTGEQKLPSQHVYGVANSPRFGDVWFDTDGTYKTVLFMTEGPGGTGVFAVDVTHAFPGRDYDNSGDQTGANEAADPNYGFGATPAQPIKVVWGKTASNYGDLAYTWSVPALGASDVKIWQLLLGAGFNTTFTAGSSPKVLRLNPVDGSLTATQTLTPQNSQSSAPALVHSQSFADSVIWQAGSAYFQEDNRVNEGVQVDLNGNLWRLPSTSSWAPSRLLNLTAGNPLYYPPAVASYPSSGASRYDLYAFSSGCFYEKNTKVNANSPTNQTFFPNLYLAAKPNGTSAAAYTAIQIKSIPTPDGSGHLGARAQVTAPPLLFVAKPGSSSNPFALFLVYDPDEFDATTGNCAGTSYIIKLEFDPQNVTLAPAMDVYVAGFGAASGFAIAGEKVLVSRSYVGENGRATLQEVPNLRIPPGNLSGNVDWWLELQ
jgi:hypothetical protein